VVAVVKLWAVQMDPSAGRVLQNSVHLLMGDWGFQENFCSVQS
jgi:hypothetical protein